MVFSYCITQIWNLDDVEPSRLYEDITLHHCWCRPTIETIGLHKAIQKILRSINRTCLGLFYKSNNSMSRYTSVVMYLFMMLYVSDLILLYIYIYISFRKFSTYITLHFRLHKHNNLSLPLVAFQSGAYSFLLGTDWVGCYRYYFRNDFFTTCLSIFTFLYCILSPFLFLFRTNFYKNTKRKRIENAQYK